MLITTSLNQPKCLILFPHQGWNLTYHGNPVFISSYDYPYYINDYISESVKRRSTTCNFQISYNPIKRLFEILPANFEIKLMLSLRAASLMLFLLKKANILPQQIFLFESSDQLTLSISSMLLKTNNSFDKVFPSLADKPEKLLEEFSLIYDGIAVTIDHPSIKKIQREKGLDTIINDMIKNNYSTDGAQHIHVILSETSSYYKDSEKILHLHLSQILPKLGFHELPQIMNDFDCTILQLIMNDIETENNLIDFINKIMSSSAFKQKDHISIERRNTYISIVNGTKLLRRLYEEVIDKEFIDNLNSFFMSIDMSGNAQEYDIVNMFSEALDSAINNHSFEFLFIKETTNVDNITNNVILHDQDFIYVSSVFIDEFILPILKGDVTHRQLIRALDTSNMIKKSDHFCQRINTHNANGNLKVIYRYAINKSILNQNKLQEINITEHKEFYLESIDLPNKYFLPLIVDKFSNRYVVRLLESGSKANNHILITGESGQGKSFLMLKIAAHLAEMGEKVIFLDSSGSETLDELINVLPDEIINNQIGIYDIENEKFPVDPFLTYNAKRSDSQAKQISNTLLSVAYDATEAQSDKLKTLILEKIDEIYDDNRISPQKIKDLLVDDQSTLTALRAKLIPILLHLDKNINYEQTWEELLELKQNILIFSLDAHLEKSGKKLFDILLTSLYNYHAKHRNRNIWIFIDEIYDQNLKESGIINKIFSQGRKNRMNVVGATQEFRLSKSEEWDTLNNARTKIFFKPHSSSINDVMKELNLSPSKRSIFSQMKEGECILSSELYSKILKSNHPAIVSGVVPKEYTSVKEMRLTPTFYGAGVPQSHNIGNIDKTSSTDKR